MEEQAIPTIEELQETVVTRVNPLLAAHLGGAEVSGFEDNIVYIRLTGECAGCQSAAFTLEDVVKKEIFDAWPIVKDVELDTTVPQDMIDMALKILKK
ncbi:MAG: NifU family protein [Clostridiales Family XIII bacterium]|nr:NifU family protein [Clostridiales Family XIII bacterium]